MNNRVIIFCLAAAGLMQNGALAQDPWDHYHYGESYYTDPVHSPTAIPDGSGVATTGVVSRAIVQDAAFTDPHEAVEEMDMAPADPGAPATAAAAERGLTALDVSIGHGEFTVGDTDGRADSIGIPLKYKHNDRLTLKSSFMLNYTTLKDADFNTVPPRNVNIVGMGALFSPVYGVYIGADKRAFRWFITPTVGVMLREAERADVGTFTYIGGISSNYYRKLGDRLILNVGNSISHTYSTKSKGRYFDLTRRTQQVFVNGIQLIYPWERWVFSAMVMDTRFGRDSAVTAWQTYGGSVGYRLGKKISLRGYVETDQGTDYQGWTAGISSSWKF
jgi:hypothetical protein